MNLLSLTRARLLVIVGVFLYGVRVGRVTQRRRSGLLRFNEHWRFGTALDDNGAWKVSWAWNSEQGQWVDITPKPNGRA